MLGLFPSLNPDAIGGVEEAGRVAWSAIQQSRGIDHCKLLCYSPGPIRNVSNDPFGPLTVYSKPGAAWTALSKRWSVSTVLVWHLGLLQLLPLLRLGPAKVVVFLHGVEAWRRHNWIVLSLLKRVDLFLTNSTYTWERFVDGNPQFRHYPQRTVHLGLGTPLASPPITVDRNPVAAMIGRMDKAEGYKGHREMIGVWRQVAKRVPDAELWVVGGGNLRPALEALANEAGVGNQVRFFGRVSEEKKQEVLEQCRCLALPSRGEGFGLVYLEAMRHRKPCLVSTADAGREVVNPPEAGLAASPASPEEIADATCRLLSGGPEWAGFAERARCRYETQFTAAHFQQRLLEALCL